MKQTLLKTCLWLLVLLVCDTFTIAAQTKLISSAFTAYNVSGESMCAVSISNTDDNLMVSLEAVLKDGSNTPLVKVISAPFYVAKGVVNTTQLGIKIASITYLNSAIGDYIKTYRQLPSGRYNYCVSIKSQDGVDDEWCDEVVSETSSFLTLVNPPDKDTLEVVNPLLIWNHSESFNLTQQGQYYRLLLTELKRDQTAESAITINTPLYLQNFLTRHDVLYPLDAPKLNAGSKYAWQVQKVVNGIITNKTDAWEFVYKGKAEQQIMLVEITPKLNVSPYVVVNDKIRFMFNEEYSSSTTSLNGEIQTPKNKIVPIKLSDKASTSVIKRLSGNTFEVDLDGLKLKSGIHVLKLYNEKNQQFLLQFSIQ